MNIEAKYSVEQIENGWIVRDLTANRAVHVAYDFHIARQVEQFLHDQVVESLADHAALAAEGVAAARAAPEAGYLPSVTASAKPMQQDEI